MKMNTKVRYGLRAMIEIAQSPNGILQKEISARQDIPLLYLDSIISGLRNAGLIVNRGGKGSGYILALKQEDISVHDIYRAFEPALVLVNCSCPTLECKRSNICPTKDYWCELNFQIKSFMENKKLGDLVQVHKHIMENHKN